MMCGRTKWFLTWSCCLLLLALPLLSSFFFILVTNPLLPNCNLSRSQPGTELLRTRLPDNTAGVCLEGPLRMASTSETVPLTHLGKRVTEPSSAPLYTRGPQQKIMVPGPKLDFLNIFLFDLYRSNEVTWGHLGSFQGHLRSFESI